MYEFLRWFYRIYLSGFQLNYLDFIDEIYSFNFILPFAEKLPISGIHAQCFVGYRTLRLFAVH